MNLKYQYTYFIYPYVIDKSNYTQYLEQLFKDKNCELKLYEKEKELSIYSYFSFNTRAYMFQSFEFNKQEIKDIKEMDINTKVKTLAKMPAITFEYQTPERIHGKTENNDLGIFFNIQKIQLILFNTGICFLLLKTNLEDSTEFKDLLQFNYKFKSINYEKNGIEQAKNIKIQTNAFNTTEELIELILKLTGKKLRNNEDMHSFTDKFFTYSYVCVDSESWNKDEQFKEIKPQFYKFSNILSNDDNNYIESNEEDIELFKGSKYIKFGFNRYGGTLLASGVDPYNYTKLPVLFENEYLYTLLISLYQKIYIDKINLDLRSNNNKHLDMVTKEFIKFTKTTWFKEITNDENGIVLYKKWTETLDIDTSYNEVKNKYNIIYKNQDIEESKKLNRTLAIIITICLIINGITFIIYRLLI